MKNFTPAQEEFWAQQEAEMLQAFRKVQSHQQSQLLRAPQARDEQVDLHTMSRAQLIALEQHSNAVISLIGENRMIAKTLTRLASDCRGHLISRYYGSEDWQMMDEAVEFTEEDYNAVLVRDAKLRR